MDVPTEADLKLARDTTLEIIRSLSTNTENISLYVIVFLVAAMIREVAPNPEQAAAVLDTITDLVEVELNQLYADNRH